MTEGSGSNAARRTLNEIAELTQRTRAARQAYWFPLMLFGLVILGAAPFYMDQPPRVAISGSFMQSDPQAWRAPMYWLLAVPLAYLLTAVVYGVRGWRRGVTTSTTKYVVAGIGLLLLVVIGGANYHVRESAADLFIRGLIPTLAIAAGIVVLAWLERSRILACIAAVFLALTITANLYDMSNMAYRLGWSSLGSATNSIVLGLFLLVAGAVTALIRSNETT